MYNGPVSYHECRGLEVSSEVAYKKKEPPIYVGKVNIDLPCRYLLRFKAKGGKVSCVFLCISALLTHGTA